MKNLICRAGCILICLAFWVNCAAAEKMQGQAMPEPTPPADTAVAPGRFLDALGCSKVHVGREDQYRAVKEGTIDGYVLTPNIRGYRMHEVTKYRLEPSFYDSDVGICANLNSWKKVPRHLQELIDRTAEEQERLFGPKWLEMAEFEFGFQARAGIKTLLFSEQDREWFLDLAYRTGWERVVNEAPVSGPRLKELSK